MVCTNHNIIMCASIPFPILKVNQLAKSALNPRSTSSPRLLARRAHPINNLGRGPDQCCPPQSFSCRSPIASRPDQYVRTMAGRAPGAGGRPTAPSLGLPPARARRPASIRSALASCSAPPSQRLQLPSQPETAASLPSLLETRSGF